ncbi:MAG TPA: tyrosine-type recombinase/integrase [Pirellulales bacterium]|nr:tyrosine-type recombinase/integrase [Pirellulales bacterium]
MVAVMLHYHKKQGQASNFYHRQKGPPAGQFQRRRPGRAARVHPLVPGELWHLYKTSYRPKELRGGSIKTDVQYRIQLNHFARYLGREAVLTDLNENVVCAFLDELAKTRAPRTVNKAYWCLIALWTHAAKRRLVDGFPMIQPMDEPTRIPEAWQLPELGRLFDACRQQAGTIDGVRLADWWYGVHVVCLYTGERIAAVQSIRMANVNWERAEICIPAEARKAKTRDMVYKLPLHAFDALAAIREPGRELLFPPMNLGTFYHRYKRLLRDAGLPADRRCKPQKLRRTFASYLEAAGGNATAALEHASRSVTVRNYLDPRICGGQNPADLLPPIPTAKREGDAA